MSMHILMTSNFEYATSGLPADSRNVSRPRIPQSGKDLSSRIASEPELVDVSPMSGGLAANTSLTIWSRKVSGTRNGFPLINSVILARQTTLRAVLPRTYDNSFCLSFLAHFGASLARYIQSMRNKAPTRNSGPEINRWADQCIRPQVQTTYQTPRQANISAPAHSQRQEMASTARTIHAAQTRSAKWPPTLRGCPDGEWLLPLLHLDTRNRHMVKQRMSL